jgi:hypothetical protein
MPWSLIVGLGVAGGLTISMLAVFVTIEGVHEDSAFAGVHSIHERPTSPISDT